MPPETSRPTLASTLARVRITPSICAAVAVATLGASAIAGPTWDSDWNDDAGSGPYNAQAVDTNGTVLMIDGSLQAPGLLGGGDLSDMYLVRITQPSVLSLSTAGGDRGGYSSFNSSLFLFRAVLGADGTYSAQALLGNDDADDGSTGSFIGNAANDGSGFSITDSGYYFILITLGGLSPRSASGDFLWQGLDEAGTVAFGGAQNFATVAGDAASDGGNYQIRLNGVSGIPAPGALALLSLASFRAGRGRRR